MGFMRQLNNSKVSVASACALPTQRWQGRPTLLHGFQSLALRLPGSKASCVMKLLSGCCPTLHSKRNWRRFNKHEIGRALNSCSTSLFGILETKDGGICAMFRSALTQKASNLCKCALNSHRVSRPYINLDATHATKMLYFFILGMFACLHTAESAFKQELASPRRRFSSGPASHEVVSKLPR